MRYRLLDGNGDYVLGSPFLANSSACVAQAVVTRLGLMQGEWYLDTNDGVPYYQSILGKHYRSNPDAIMQQAILTTQGVTAIVSYSSKFDGNGRLFSLKATINTLYGVTTVTV
jgi:hypothetical protein